MRVAYGTFFLPILVIASASASHHSDPIPIDPAIVSGNAFQPDASRPGRLSAAQRESDRMSLHERMNAVGALPTFRIGLGYPEMAFGQAGLALTRLSGGFLYAACQAGVKGYAGIAGATVLELGSRHSPPFFITLGAQYRREWRDPEAWNAGPVFQIGFLNVGLQTSIRYGREWEGEAAILIQLFPPLN